jgi:hypothetical protein
VTALSEFKPRGRDVVIGGVPWLARMADKARAKADGTIGDYIYPCPVDQRLLQAAGISADEFMEMATSAQSDEALAQAFKERSGKDDWSDFQV